VPIVQSWFELIAMVIGVIALWLGIWDLKVDLHDRRIDIDDFNDDNPSRSGKYAKKEKR